MRRAGIILSLCVFPWFIILSGSREVDSRSLKTIRITETSMRRLATKVVMPEFPQEARKRGASGVSVAELEVDEQGDVSEVRVLEAPHESIKAAVVDAVRQWKFRRSTIGGEPVRVRSKLTFYYVNNGRKARVKNPRSAEQYGSFQVKE